MRSSVPPYQVVLPGIPSFGPGGPASHFFPNKKSNIVNDILKTVLCFQIQVMFFMLHHFSGPEERRPHSWFGQGLQISAINSDLTELPSEGDC